MMVLTMPPLHCTHPPPTHHHLPFRLPGAIDGTHIPWKTGLPDFLNYKKYTSIVAQAVVDHRLIIRDWCCGFPGSWSDKQILNYSHIGQDDGWISGLRNKGVRSLYGTRVSYYICE